MHKVWLHDRVCRSSKVCTKTEYWAVGNCENAVEGGIWRRLEAEA